MKTEASKDSDAAEGSMLTAICDPQDGRPVDIDEIIRRLGAEHGLGHNQVIAYIGSGRFAISHWRSMRKSKKQFVIDKIIEFEEQGERAEWRRKLLMQRPSGLSYVPQPERIHRLYTDQQLKEMPRF